MYLNSAFLGSLYPTFLFTKAAAFAKIWIVVSLHVV